MARIITGREQAKNIPFEALEIWAFASTTDDASTIYDVSGKGRDLTVASNPPTLQTVVKSNSVYFSGTNNAYEMNSAITLKHIFLVVRIDEATFVGNRGLFGSSTQNVLIGNNTTALFQDNGLGANFDYRLDDVAYADNAMSAPMNQWGIIELVLPNGITFANLRIGNLGVGFKGSFAEIIGYSAIRGTLKRLEIYRELARTYQIWRRLPNGTPIFPFENNHASPFEFKPYVIQSKALPNGNYIERRKGVMLRGFDVAYGGVRRQREVDAVETFEIQNYGVSNVVLEDNSFCPPRQFTGRIFAPIQKQPQDILNWWNYQMKFQQIEEGFTDLALVNDEVILPPDTQQPTPPTGLALVSKTHNSITVSFNQSTDNQIVAGYQRRLNGGAFVTNATTGSAVRTMVITGLTPTTAYTIDVRAFDGAPNYGGASNQITVTTDAAPASINVALASNGSTATATNQLAPTLGADNVINGLITSGNAYHSQFNTSNITFEIDFGQNRDIFQSNLHFNRADAGYNPTFVLDYWNGTTWTNFRASGQIVGAGTSALTTETTNFSSVTASKVRLVQSDAANYITIIEWEIMGTP
jgi:hypothetical protein